MTFKVEHHHYFHDLPQSTWNSQVLTQLTKIQKQGESLKTMVSETEARILAELDAATNDIAAQLEELKKPDDPEFNAALEVQIAKLKGLGAAPEA